jgi:hypothetical protein
VHRSTFRSIVTASEINPTPRRELLFLSNPEKTCWIWVKKFKVEVGHRKKMLNSGSASFSTG